MKKFLFFLAAILLFLPFQCDRTFAGEIALSFDDGPHPVFTPRILASLKAHNAKATFFVQGKNVELYPDILRAERDAGCEIGNHTFDHPHLIKYGDAPNIRQITDTQNAVFGVIGIRPIRFRPPYSERNFFVDRIVKYCGLDMTLWTVSPEDYKCQPPETIAECVLSAVVPGSIVVMHDNDLSPNTPEAVEFILIGLEERGLRSVTISELVAKK